MSPIRFSMITISAVLLLLFIVVMAAAETLDDAWKASMENDRRLNAARSFSDARKMGLQAARAARLPGVTVESGYTVLDNQPAFIFGLPTIPGIPELPREFPFEEDKSFAFRAAVSLPLYTSGRISSGIDAATALLNSAQSEEKQVTRDLKLEVAESYVAVLRTQRAVEVAQSNVASLSSHFGDVRNLLDQGLVARNDFLAAQVALSDARQKSLRAGNALELAQSQYNRLLGRTLDQPVKIDEVAAEPYEGTIDTLTVRALESRLELVRFDERAKSLRFTAAGISAETDPQVSVTGAYSYKENRYVVHEDMWSFVVGLKWNIFDGGISRNRAGSVLREADSLEELKKDLASRIALDVKRHWLDTIEASRRIDVTREATVQAEENLTVARDRYREGVGTNTEVLDAETLRTVSYTNYHNAVYDYAMAVFRLRHAVGDL